MVKVALVIYCSINVPIHVKCKLGWSHRGEYEVFVSEDLYMGRGLTMVSGWYCLKRHGWMSLITSGRGWGLITLRWKMDCLHQVLQALQTWLIIGRRAGIPKDVSRVFIAPRLLETRYRYGLWGPSLVEEDDDEMKRRKII